MVQCMSLSQNMKIIALACMLLACLLYPPATCLAVESPIKVFDGSDKTILYRTSSHAGQKQLEELLRMIPGGENLSVLKPPYNWKSGDNVKNYLQFPIVASRMGNHFNGPFERIDPASMRLQTEADLGNSEKIEHYFNMLDERVALLQGYGAQVLVLVTGHYTERGDTIGQQLLWSEQIYQQWAETITAPYVYVAQTIGATAAVYPASVRTDLFHANATANYAEGLEIIRQFCRHDNITVPPEVESFVADKLSTSLETRTAITIQYPDKDFALEQPLRQGDQISTQAQVDQTITHVHILLHEIAGDDYLIAQDVPVPSNGQIRHTWTVVNKMASLGNRLKPKKGMNQLPMTSLPNKRLKRKERRYCIRIVDASNMQQSFDFSTSFEINFNAEPHAQPLIIKLP